MGSKSSYGLCGSTGSIAGSSGISIECPDNGYGDYRTLPAADMVYQQAANRGTGA
jgi:hypothetical protein